MLDLTTRQPREELPLKTRQLVYVVAISMLTSCSTMSRRHQLERVAKDWCETIRASQVIAVYPLTQDLQPGDVFLVQTPIDQQQAIYESTGFLPLDNHLARIHPGGYSNFYSKSFLDEAAIPPTELPKDWLKQSWATAPSAAFPSYAFSVSESTGFSLALPISGIPVGLSLLDTKTATGSVSLKDARTIGLDTQSLYLGLKSWVNDPEFSDRRALLSNFAPRAEGDAVNYLRVVTRVYLLGAIDVQLNDARSFGAGADVGAARPVELFVPDTADGIDDNRRAGRENYVQGLQRLNSMTGTRPVSHRRAAPGDLTSTEYAAHERGRSEEEAAEIKRAEDANKAAQSSVDSAKTDTAAKKGILEEKNAELAELEKTVVRTQAEQEKAEALLEEKRNALAASQAANPSVPADVAAAQTAVDDATTALSSKKNAVKAAETAVTDKEKEVAKAQADFDEANAKLREAEGKASVTQSAIDQLKDFAPGGSFRFTAASNRTISMSEEFDQPLVVGYLGFDVPIGVNGTLGSPIPTHARLQFGAAAEKLDSNPSVRVFQNAAQSHLYDSLKALSLSGSEDAELLKGELDALVGYIPALQPRFKSDKVIFEGHGTKADFGDYLTFNKNRNLAVKRMRGYADAGLGLDVGGRVLEAEELRARASDLEASVEEAQAFSHASEQLLLFWAQNTKE